MKGPGSLSAPAPRVCSDLGIPGMARGWSTLLLLFFSPWAGLCLASDVSIPWTGVAHANRAPSLIAGTPGGALAYSLPEAGTLLAVHPEQIAWLIRDDEGGLWLRDNAGRSELLPVEPRRGGWRVIRWSPSGSRLALCDGESCQIFHNEAEGLRPEWILAAAADDLAISDDGQAALWITDGLLWMGGPTLPPRIVISTAPSAFAFLRKSRIYAVADEAGLHVAGLQPGRPQPSPSEELASLAPVRQLLPAGRFGWLALASDGPAACRLWLLSPEGRIQQAQDCPSAEARLSPAGAEGLIQLVDPAQRTLWFGRVTSAGLQLFFVPESSSAQ